MEQIESDEPQDIMSSSIPKVAGLESIFEDESILSALLPTDVLNATKREVDKLMEEASQFALNNSSGSTTSNGDDKVEKNLAKGTMNSTSELIKENQVKLNSTSTTEGTIQNSSFVDISPFTPVIDTKPKESEAGGQTGMNNKMLAFDKPFIWYVHDDKLGFLQFGSVNSLATYRKEYGIEDEEDAWLFDAYKTLLWNCP